MQTHMKSSSNTARDIHGETYILRKPIAAIPASPGEMPPFGPVMQLPTLSKLTVLGPAFNDFLVRVRCHDTVYFVFIEDLGELCVSRRLSR